MGRRLTDEQAAEVMRTAGLEPLEPYPGAQKPWRTRCGRCGTEGSPTLSRVKQGGTGCKVCGRRKSDLSRRRDAADSAQVMRDAGLEPLEPYPGRHFPWRCRCTTCGAEVSPHLSSVAKGGGCRVCARAAAVGTRVEQEQAEKDMLAAGAQPLEPLRGAALPWLCRCLTCGKEIRPRLHNVRKGQGACKYCRHAKSAPKRMRDGEEAAAIMSAAGLTPLEPYPGRSSRWRCRCESCGEEVDSRLSVVLSGGGCGQCADSGFKTDRPSLVYLLTHNDWGAHKIGVANVGSGRLDKHRLRGWTVVATHDCLGADALRIERCVLSWWRDDLGCEPFLRDVDGWTETVDAAAVSTNEVWAFVEQVAAEG